MSDAIESHAMRVATNRRQEGSAMRKQAGRALGVALMWMLATVPVIAQSEAPTNEGELVVVTSVEYAYEGLPTSVPVGTRLGLANGGVEVHDMMLGRIADGETASLEEILNMENPVGDGIIEIVGEPLRAAPGETADGTLLLDREGRYAIVCFLPQGLADIEALTALDSGTPVEDLPAEVQAVLMNPFHAVLGEKQEFLVTAAGTPPGPLPPPVGSPVAAG
jgi:hypothetical protein